jgi:hypothetical protein
MLTQNNTKALYKFRIKHTITIYKDIYISHILTKVFIKKFFLQIAMSLQTYCSYKQERIDPLVFNKAPYTHIDSFKTK